MLYLTGIVIDLFLVVLLASKRNKSEADVILTVWLFLIGLHLFLFYLFVTKRYYEYPLMLGLGIPFPLLHGPFLFLYTSSLTQQVNHGVLRFLHFLPFVLAYLLMLPFFFSPAEHKIYTYEHQGSAYQWILFPLHLAIIISGILYVVLSLGKLSQHRKNIENQFSNTDKINLNWLRYLIFGMAVIWIAVIFTSDAYIYATVVVYVFFIGFFGIKQTAVFAPNSPVPPMEVPPGELADEDVHGQSAAGIPEEKADVHKIKYLKSGLSGKDQEEIHDMLNRLMEQKKPFTNPDLTLGEMAEQLDVHPNNLSQVINSVAQKNFYDYINSRRVEEFIYLAGRPENQQFTLLSIAYECGFNSKSSFNRNFRRITGLSPSDYLKHQRGDSAD